MSLYNKSFCNGAGFGYRDCLACKASMSEEGTEEEGDKLWCSEKECYVNEEDCCEEFSR